MHWSCDTASCSKPFIPNKEGTYPPCSGPGTSTSASFNNNVAQVVNIKGSIWRDISTNLNHNKRDSIFIWLDDQDLISVVRFPDTGERISIDQNFALKANTNYFFHVRGNCSNIHADLNFEYNTGDSSLITDRHQYIYGGLRIKSITNYDKDITMLGKSLFTYINPSDTTKSSGYFTHDARIRLVAVKDIYESYNCPDGSNDCSSVVHSTYLYYSDPLTGIYPNGLNYQYVQVKKIAADGRNNGITKYKFAISKDVSFGSEMPLISYSDHRGQPLKEEIYDNTNNIISKKEYFYSDHPLVNKLSTGFKLIKVMAVKPGPACTSSEYTLNDFYNPVEQTNHSNWYKQDSIIQTSYYNQSQVKSKTAYIYDDTLSCMPTTQLMTTSVDNRKRITNFIYPTQLQDTISKLMVQNNILDLFIQKEERVENTLLINWGLLALKCSTVM